MPYNEDLIAKLRARAISDQYKKDKAGKTLKRADNIVESDRLSAVYHDDLAEYLSRSREDANLYFQGERSTPSIQFYHDLNSPEIISSLQLTNNPLSDTDLKSAESDFLSRIKTTFTVKYINPARQKEDASLSLKARVNPAFKDRREVLNFYNSPVTVNNKQINALGIYKSILDDYTKFSKYSIASQIKNKEEFQKTLSTKLDPIMKEIEYLMKTEGSGADNFWGLLLTAKGDMLNFLDKNKKLVDSKDMRQLERSFATINELFEQAILIKKFENLKDLQKSGNIKKIEIRAVGAVKSIDLNEFLEGKGEDILTPEILEDYILNKTASDRTLRSITQKGIRTSGGKSDTLDYEIIIYLNDGTVVTDKVDAKFGLKDKYSSSPITETFGKFLDDANYFLGGDIATQFLQLILSFTLIDTIMGTDVKSKYVTTILKYFITYVGITSKGFEEKFGLGSEAVDTPNLIVVGGQYVWFSDFLKGFTLVYLDPTSMKSSSSDLSTNIVASIRKQVGSDSISLSKMQTQTLIPNFEQLINFIKTNPSFADLKNNKDFMDEINNTILELRSLSSIFYIKLADVFSKYTFN